MQFGLEEIILAMIVSASTDAVVYPDDLICLSRNIYHEARGESRDGQIAVAWVTMNRLADNSVCEVVYEPSQFSWTWDGRPDEPADKIAQLDAMLIARDVLTGEQPDVTDGATHFYAYRHVEPYWAGKFQQTAVIGNHRFMME